MATETVERPRTGGPGSGVGGNWLVIVLNDDHNTFDHVARTLSNVIPGVSLDQGFRFADRIHNSGQAIVSTGAKAGAGLYCEVLKDAGLPMAPLERHWRPSSVARRDRCAGEDGRVPAREERL